MHCLWRLGHSDGLFCPSLLELRSAIYWFTCMLKKGEYATVEWSTGRDGARLVNQAKQKILEPCASVRLED